MLGTCLAPSLIAPPSPAATRGDDERWWLGEARATGQRQPLPRPHRTGSRCLGSRRTPIAGAVACACAVPLAVAPAVAGQPRRLHVTVRRGVARTVLWEPLAH